MIGTVPLLLEPCKSPLGPGAQESQGALVDALAQHNCQTSTGNQFRQTNVLKQNRRFCQDPWPKRAYAIVQFPVCRRVGTRNGVRTVFVFEELGLILLAGPLPPNRQGREKPRPEGRTPPHQGGWT